MIVSGTALGYDGSLAMSTWLSLLARVAVCDHALCARKNVFLRLGKHEYDE